MRYYVMLYGRMGFLQGSVAVTSDVDEGTMLKTIGDIRHHLRDFSTKQAIAWWESQGLKAQQTPVLPSGNGYTTININVHSGRMTQAVVPEAD